ncbi:LysM domain-containing protein, partial [Burkholderia gladioli]|uniref:beta strand repeat-containing protein n=1 Tax=Burkholderia gladioli TaxID=28095 RepID=UPI002FE3F9DB
MSTPNTAVGTFLGNLQAQGYTGKDGAANAAADAYGVAVGLGYSGLAVAADEAGMLGGKLPGPIGIVGNMVTLTVGLASAGNVCNAVGVVAGAATGIAAAALVTPEGPGAQFAVGTAAAWVAQKVATALCNTVDSYIDSNQQQDANQSPAPAQALQSEVGLSSSILSSPIAPAASDPTTMASAIVQFRPSPDYTGADGAYTVGTGETLTGIAQAQGISLSLLESTNPQITDPNSLRAGQIIQLPPSASDYISGGASDSGADEIPDDNAQASALSELIQQSSGLTLSVITENSGQIAVLSSANNSVSIIENDGSISAISLSEFNQQLQTTLGNYQDNGYVDSNTQIIYSNYLSGTYGVLAGDGSGTVVTNDGLVSQNSSGDITAITSSGQTYTYDAAAEQGVFASDSSASNSVIADTQTTEVNGNVDDNIVSYASDGDAQYNEELSTSATGAVSMEISGTGSSVTLDDATITLTSNTSLTVSGSGNSIVGNSSASGSTFTLEGTGAALDTVALNGATNLTVLLGDATTAVSFVSTSATVRAERDGANISGSAGDQLAILGVDVNLNVSGGTYDVVGDGDNADASNSRISLAAGSSLAIIGSSNTLDAAAGATISVSSTSEDVIVNDVSGQKISLSGSSVTVSGDNGSVKGGAQYIFTVNEDGSQSINVMNANGLRIESASFGVDGSSSDVFFQTSTGQADEDLFNYSAGGSQEDLFAGSNYLGHPFQTSRYSEIIENWTGSDGSGSETSTILDNAKGGSTEAIYTGLDADTSSLVESFNGSNATGVETMVTTTYTDGEIKEQFLSGLGAGVISQAEYSFQGNTWEITDLSAGGSQEDVLTGLANNVSSLIKTFSGSDATGTETQAQYDFSDGTSEVQSFEGLPEGVSVETQYFSSTNGNGSITEDILDYTAGGSQSTVLTNLSEDVISIVDDFQGPDGSGAESAQITNYVSGDSQEQIFVGLAAGVSSLVENFTNKNATGNEANAIYDFYAGSSEVQSFGDLPEDVASIEQYFAGVDGTGTETSQVTNFSSGGSQFQFLTGLPSNITSQVDDFTGADASGTETSIMTDYQVGTSSLQVLSGLANGVASETEDFSGLDGAGAKIETVIDYADGSSQIRLYESGSALQQGVSQLDINYAGPNGNGAETSEISDFIGGGSQEAVYQGLPSGIASTAEVFTGADASGTETATITTYINEQSTGSLGYYSQEQFLTSPPAGVTNAYADFSGRDGTGVETEVSDFVTGGSELQFSNLLPTVASETEDYTGADGTGTRINQ